MERAGKAIEHSSDYSKIHLKLSDAHSSTFIELTLIIHLPACYPGFIVAAFHQRIHWMIKSWSKELKSSERMSTSEEWFICRQKKEQKGRNKADKERGIPKICA